MRRHKLTGKDGNINILDSRDFVQFFNQRVSDLHHVIVGKEVGHLVRGVPRPRPAHSFGPRYLAACSAGTGPKKDRPEEDDRTHDKQNK